MIDNKKLGILTILAVGMVVVAVIVSTQQASRGPSIQGPTYLIQGLDPMVIGVIRIGSSDKTVTLRRQGKGFVVVNKDNYPADNKAINDLLTNCMDIQVTQSVTSNPDNHADLGVTEDKARTIVRFYKIADGNETLITGLIVGNYREGAQGSYVRLANSNQVYIAQSIPWIRDTALDFLNQEILAVKTEDINSITVQGPSGSYTLKKRPNTDTFEMIDLPEGKRLKEYEARSVATAINSLRFDDVKRGPDPNLQFNRTYIARMNDSTVYTLRLAQKEGNTFLSCHAEYTDTNQVLIDPTKKDSPEELKKKEARLLAQERALRFTSRHTGWIYQIPSWKANYLIKDVNDILEAMPKPLESTEPNQPATFGPSEPNIIQDEPNQLKPEPNSP